MSCHRWLTLTVFNLGPRLLPICPRRYVIQLCRGRRETNNHLKMSERKENLIWIAKVQALQMEFWVSVLSGRSGIFSSISSHHLQTTKHSICALGSVPELREFPIKLVKHELDIIFHCCPASLGLRDPVLWSSSPSWFVFRLKTPLQSVVRHTHVNSMS